MAPHPVEESRERLYASAADPEVDIAEGALWIAAEEYPDLAPEAYRAYLDGLAGRIEGALPSAADGDTRRAALRTEVFVRERFAGNASDYYDPRNSYLNDVIDRRLGIPITLAVVYLSVARRMGRRACGLNAPGHFLVLDDGVVLDPFDGGRPVPHAELMARLERAGARAPAASLAALLRSPPDGRAILARMLANLRTCHLHRGDVARALAAVDRLVHIDADNPTWLRDRAALFQRLDCAQAAAGDLEAYLARVPDDPEAEALRAIAARLARDLPSLQ